METGLGRAISGAAFTVITGAGWRTMVTVWTGGGGGATRAAVWLVVVDLLWRELEEELDEEELEEEWPSPRDSWREEWVSDRKCSSRIPSSSAGAAETSFAVSTGALIVLTMTIG